MYDTNVTVVGNALHEPEWRRVASSGAMVTTFKIASTARRRSRETGAWIDGNSLRVRVSCWRTLAHNVKESVTVGDPLIVSGRLFTRDWVDDSGARRTAYELEARSVGHDLSRGRAVFERVRAHTATSAIEDSEGDQHIGGEPTEAVPDDEAPTRFDDSSFEAALDRPPPDPVTHADGAVPDRDLQGSLGVLHDGGFTAVPVAPVAADDQEPVAVAEPRPDPSGPTPDPSGPTPDPSGLAPVIDDDPDPVTPTVEAADPSSTGRRRGKPRSRTP